MLKKHLFSLTVLTFSSQTQKKIMVSSAKVFYFPVLKWVSHNCSQPKSALGWCGEFFPNNSHLNHIPSPLKQYLERYYSKKRGPSVSHGPTQLQMVHNVTGSKWKKTKKNILFLIIGNGQGFLFHRMEMTLKIIIELCKIFFNISKGKNPFEHKYNW